MEYEKMLERARKNIPEAKQTERFEMPQAEVQAGKQTFLKNFSEIAKALRRDPKHVARFFFKELAVPGSIRGPELMFQGKISGHMINLRLSEYIREFVTCSECGKPDTILHKEGRFEFMKCEACGARKSFKSL